MQITVAYDKVDMDMLRIRMHGEQHLIPFTPEELTGKLFRHPVRFLIGQLIIILRMKGNRKFMRQDLLLLPFSACKAQHPRTEKYTVLQGDGVSFCLIVQESFICTLLPCILR